MPGDGERRVFLLAGPNGAGKTTFARELLPKEAACPVFINADLIAAGLSPFAPERAAIRAGRLMLELIDAHVARGESFALETTLAAGTMPRDIGRWRDAGYRVSLVFVRLSSPELAIARVAERVRQGGHAVEPLVIRRRFARGLATFERCKAVVDEWTLWDGSGRTPRLVDAGGAR